MMRHSELLLVVQVQVRKAELEAHMVEHAHNLKVALERKRLAHGRYLSTLAVLESWKVDQCIQVQCLR